MATYICTFDSELLQIDSEDPTVEIQAQLVNRWSGLPYFPLPRQVRG